ncbi:hypothetical protein OU800_02055 [Pseudomonas sp. GOM7]|uniref:hypothetical protein n=1 Tax=Pseudomonas sp. GOM7 TaxID=2998079 RepID=UPI00227B7A14|nr:hypothetical protein [Pseudomonas sp. GOM7]WAJ38040.1 hypothetical protein OU800_02055 [Pseudomonas sp. GOM7]
MVIVGFFIALGAWVWSVARGIQVSLICVVLNFMFPPVSQGIFALYEPPMRAPLLFMAIGLGMMYLGGGLKIS